MSILSRSTFNSNLDNSIKKLNKIELDMNIYIDSYHLFLFFEECLNYVQKEYQEIFQQFNLGPCPKININENIYSDLISNLIFKFTHSYEDKLKSEINKTENLNALSLFDLMPFLSFRETLDPSEILKNFHKRQLKFNKSKIFPSHYLEINKYINFFAAEGVNENLIIGTLTNYLKNTSDPEKIQRISKYINYFQTNNIQKYTNKQLETIHRFNFFRNAMKNFNDRSAEIVSELNLGKTRFDIHDKRTFFVEFSEKAVDASLIVSALKDLEKSDKKSIFSFITNDTDYLPLFKETKSRAELIWLYANKFNPSKELKKIINDDKIYNLYDFYENTYFFSFFSGEIENQLQTAYTENKNLNKTSQTQDLYLYISHYSELREEIEWQKKMDEYYQDMYLEEMRQINTLLDDDLD